MFYYAAQYYAVENKNLQEKSKIPLADSRFAVPATPVSHSAPLRVSPAASRVFFGGLEGIRTLDLSDANRTLSQLSYKPVFLQFLQLFRWTSAWHNVVGMGSALPAKLQAQLKQLLKFNHIIPQETQFVKTFFQIIF